MKKRTFRQYQENRLRKRNITILHTNSEENCILAKDKDGNALFLYTHPGDHRYRKTLEKDFFDQVPPEYAATFEQLLLTHHLRLLTTCSAERGHPFCQKIVSDVEYYNLQRMANGIKILWENKGEQEIEIDSSYSTVSVEMGEDHGWFFQGHEADNLIADLKQSPLNHFCTIEQILLYKAGGW